MKVKLLVVHGRPEGKSLEFPPGEYVFGRGAECHIRPNSDWVSRQHCLVRVLPDRISVRDLGSRNGTLVNGERVLGERPLEEGDQLQVGPLVFELHLEETPAVSDPPGLDDTGMFCNDTSEIPAAPRPAPGPAATPPKESVAPAAS